jgi:hypothetical protein
MGEGGLFKMCFIRQMYCVWGLLGFWALLMFKYVELNTAVW